MEHKTNIHYFESDTFKDDYKEALLEYVEELDKATAAFREINKKLNDRYIDPDGETYNDNSMSYYNLLTLFLKLRAEDFEMPYRFKGPSCNESKIFVYEINSDNKELSKKPILRLTSDQLGFSSFNDEFSLMGRVWEDFDNDRYPLHRYFGLTRGRSDAVDFISEYIYNTRTLGGAFIWPTDCTESNRKYKYEPKSGDGRTNTTAVEAQSLTLKIA